MRQMSVCAPRWRLKDAAPQRLLRSHLLRTIHSESHWSLTGQPERKNTNRTRTDPSAPLLVRSRFGFFVNRLTQTQSRLRDEDRELQSMIYFQQFPPYS